MGCLSLKPGGDLAQLTPPKEIEDLFNDPKYSKDKVMSREQFSQFLRDVQGEDAGNDVFEEIIKHLDSAGHRRIAQTNGLHLGDFFAYLFGDRNLPIPHQVHQDMNASLAHYFIYTRAKIHVFSPRGGLCNPRETKKNIAAIKEALKMGIRAIQLDLSYIPKKNGGIHTSSYIHENLDIRGCLRKYMEAIKDHAFSETSNYPLIIAFEGAFGSRIQSRVAQLAETLFAGKLHNPKKTDPQRNILSPENLKNKIILVQAPKHPPEMEKKDRTQESKSKSFAKTNAAGEENMKLENVESEAYKSLITIVGVKEKPTLREILGAKNDSICYLRLPQLELENPIRANEHDQIVEFTQTNLLTVNPMDKHSGSSNCNPFTGWRHGAQMVAVNTQDHDKYLGVMQGMFRANGGCGYVKKPDSLLKAVDNMNIDPRTKSPIIKSILKVKIYMGHGWHLEFCTAKFDLFSLPDFFLKVQIFGVPNDDSKRETKFVQDSWRPNWNQEFVFELTVPELALLSIEGGSGKFAGQTCLPIWELKKKGIRAVPLYNKRGVMYKHVKLLVRLELTDHS